MKCLVTGASGHLGAELVRELVRRDARVYAMVRPESDLWRIQDLLDRVTLVHADLSDPQSLKRAVASAGPEALFHLAWFGVTGSLRNAPQQLTLNVTASMQLVTAAAEAGCGKFIGVGSQAEYGNYDCPLREDLEPHPVTAYGVGKLCSATLAQKLCELHGMQYAWVRLISAYGPRDDERHMIPTLIRSLLAGQTPALTAGDQTWDYLYVEDAAEALYRVGTASSANGVFNLASGESFPLRRIVEQIRDQINPELPLGFGAVPYRSDQVMRLQGDISRLRRTTGWEPRYSLEDGLRKTVAWYQSNQERAASCPA